MSIFTRTSRFATSATTPGSSERVQITLTSAQILALNTTPITIVAAPGAGKYISVDEVVGKLTFNSIAYTGANNVEIRYTNGAGVKVSGDLASAWLDNASTRVDRAITAAASALPANAPIVASVPVANPGAGDGTVTFDVLYRTVSV